MVKKRYYGDEDFHFKLSVKPIREVDPNKRRRLILIFSFLLYLYTLKSYPYLLISLYTDIAIYLDTDIEI